MGYRMDQIGSSFLIRRTHLRGALAAVKALAGKGTIRDDSGRHYSWVDDEDYQKAKTLSEALKAWRWSARRNPEGDIVELRFDGEKLGDESTLFIALAPFVEPDSFLEMRGEDGVQWRWIFDGQIVKEWTGRVVYTMPGARCAHCNR